MALLEAAALQRAHFHHFVHQAVEQRHVDELGIGSGDIKLPWAVHVNAGSGGGGQGPMAYRYEFGGPRIAGARISEYLVGFEIEEAHAHGAVAEDAFEMAASAASAETFLGIERDHGMPALPNSFAPWITAEANAVAQRPHANQFAKFVAGRGDSGGHGVGVVEDAHGSRKAASS